MLFFIADIKGRGNAALHQLAKPTASSHKLKLGAAFPVGVEAHVILFFTYFLFNKRKKPFPILKA